jgi:hypothetical protein
VTRSGVAMLGTRAARVVRLGEVARHQPDSFAGRLPVRCLISGRLLHGELSRRVCLQAFVRDGSTAADRPGNTTRILNMCRATDPEMWSASANDVRRILGSTQ